MRFNICSLCNVSQICADNASAGLCYLTFTTAHILHPAARRGAGADCRALSLPGNPSEAEWQIPQQGVEKEICHAVR